MTIVSYDPFLKWLALFATGEELPDLDETKMRALADVYDVCAEGLEQVGPIIVRMVASARANFQGTAADAFIEVIAPYVEGANAYIEGAAEHFRQMAQVLRQLALDVEYMMLVILEELSMLAAEFTFASVVGYYLPEVWAWFKGQAAIRGTMINIAKRAVQARFPLLSKVAWNGRYVLLSLVTNYANQVGVVVLAQGSQMAMGTRDESDWNEKYISDAAVVATVGFFLAPITHGLGNQLGGALTKLLDRLGGPAGWHKNFAHNVTEVLSEGIHEFGAETVAIAILTGQFVANLFALTSGLTSAVMRLAGKALGGLIHDLQVAAALTGIPEYRPETDPTPANEHNNGGPDTPGNTNPPGSTAEAHSAATTNNTSPDSGSGNGPGNDPETSPSTGPKTGSDARPNSGSETGPRTGLDSDSGVGPRTGLDSGSETGPRIGLDSGSETGPRTGLDSDSGVGPRTGPDSGSETSPRTGSSGTTDPAPEPVPGSDRLETPSTRVPTEPVSAAPFDPSPPDQPLDPVRSDTGEPGGVNEGAPHNGPPVTGTAPPAPAESAASEGRPVDSDHQAFNGPFPEPTHPGQPGQPDGGQWTDARMKQEAREVTVDVTDRIPLAQVQLQSAMQTVYGQLWAQGRRVDLVGLFVDRDHEKDAERVVAARVDPARVDQTEAAVLAEAIVRGLYEARLQNIPHGGAPHGARNPRTQPEPGANAPAVPASLAAGRGNPSLGVPRRRPVPPPAAPSAAGVGAGPSGHARSQVPEPPRESPPMRAVDRLREQAAKLPAPSEEESSGGPAFNAFVSHPEVAILERAGVGDAAFAIIVNAMRNDRPVDVARLLNDIVDDIKGEVAPDGRTEFTRLEVFERFDGGPDALRVFRSQRDKHGWPAVRAGSFTFVGMGVDGLSRVVDELAVASNAVVVEDRDGPGRVWNLLRDSTGGVQDRDGHAVVVDKATLGEVGALFMFRAAGNERPITGIELREHFAGAENLPELRRGRFPDRLKFIGHGADAMGPVRALFNMDPAAQVVVAGRYLFPGDTEWGRAWTVTHVEQLDQAMFRDVGSVFVFAIDRAGNVTAGAAAPGPRPWTVQRVRDASASARYGDEAAGGATEAMKSHPDSSYFTESWPNLVAAVIDVAAGLLEHEPNTDVRQVLTDIAEDLRAGQRGDTVAAPAGLATDQPAVHDTAGTAAPGPRPWTVQRVREASASAQYGEDAARKATDAMNSHPDFRYFTQRWPNLVAAVIDVAAGLLEHEPNTDVRQVLTDIAEDLRAGQRGDTVAALAGLTMDQPAVPVPPVLPAQQDDGGATNETAPVERLVRGPSVPVPLVPVPQQREGWQPRTYDPTDPSAGAAGRSVGDVEQFVGQLAPFARPDDGWVRFGELPGLSGTADASSLAPPPVEPSVDVRESAAQPSLPVSSPSAQVEGDAERPRLLWTLERLEDVATAVPADDARRAPASNIAQAVDADGALRHFGFFDLVTGAVASNLDPRNPRDPDSLGRGRTVAEDIRNMFRMGQLDYSANPSRTGRPARRRLRDLLGGRGSDVVRTIHRRARTITVEFSGEQLAAARNLVSEVERSEWLAGRGWLGEFWTTDLTDLLRVVANDQLTKGPEAVGSVTELITGVIGDRGLPGGTSVEAAEFEGADLVRTWHLTHHGQTTSAASSPWPESAEVGEADLVEVVARVGQVRGSDAVLFVALPDGQRGRALHVVNHDGSSFLHYTYDGHPARRPVTVRDGQVMVQLLATWVPLTPLILPQPTTIWELMTDVGADSTRDTEAQSGPINAAPVEPTEPAESEVVDEAAGASADVGGELLQPTVFDPTRDGPEVSLDGRVESGELVFTFSPEEPPIPGPWWYGGLPGSDHRGDSDLYSGPDSVPRSGPFDLEIVGGEEERRFSDGDVDTSADVRAAMSESVVVVFDKSVELTVGGATAVRRLGYRLFGDMPSKVTVLGHGNSLTHGGRTGDARAVAVADLLRDTVVGAFERMVRLGVRPEVLPVVSSFRPVVLPGRRGAGRSVVIEATWDAGVRGGVRACGRVPEVPGVSLGLPGVPMVRPVPDVVAPPVGALAALTRVVPRGAVFMDPRGFVGLVNGWRGGAEPFGGNGVDATLAFLSTLHGVPRVAGGPVGVVPGPVAEMLSVEPELMGVGDAAVERVVRRAVGPGASGFVFGYGYSADRGRWFGQAWAVVRFGAELLFVDAVAGTVVPAAADALPGLGRVYAVVVDERGSVLTDESGSAYGFGSGGSSGGRVESGELEFKFSPEEPAVPGPWWYGNTPISDHRDGSVPRSDPFDLVSFGGEGDRWFGDEDDDAGADVGGELLRPTVFDPNNFGALTVNAATSSTTADSAQNHVLPVRADDAAAELLAVVPPGTSFVDPARFVGLLGGSAEPGEVSWLGREVPGFGAALAFESTWRGVPRVAGSTTEANSGVLGQAPEFVDRGPAGVTRVVDVLAGQAAGASAVLRAHRPDGSIRALNVVRFGDDVMVVDAVAGTAVAVTEEVASTLADAEDLVYAHGFGPEGADIGMAPRRSPVSPGPDADEYELAEFERARAGAELVDSASSGGEVPVPGTGGRLVQWWGGLVLVGGRFTPEMVADLATTMWRDVIWYFVGPAGEEPRWEVFRPVGRPLPVKVSDLPPAARAAINEGVAHADGGPRGHG